MRKSIYILLVIAALASCYRSVSLLDKEICRAEQLMESNPDSALAILETIDLSDIREDSLKAKFHYLRAYSCKYSLKSGPGRSFKNGPPRGV